MPSLRQQCKERFKIAFDSVRVLSGSMTFILIVDDKALKILSNTIKMMELINYGITSVQKLQLKRKRFKKIQAVYLIHPENYKMLLDDFSQDSQPQYHSIHILSLTKIAPYIMKQLSQCQSLTKRTKTLKQLYLNFSLFSENQVKLLPVIANTFSSCLLTQHEQQYQSCVASTIDQLTTILTAMSSFYIVQILYNKGGLNNFAEKVALGLKDNLESLFKYYQKNNVTNYDSGATITTFLILDRTYDPLTPLLRDYHYGPMLYDFKNLDSHKCTIVKNKQTKVYNLDDNDEIMQKYHSQHFATTLTGLQKDFQAFSQTHNTAKFQKNQQSLSMAQMSQMLKTMPKYNDFKDKYGFHIQMLSDLYQHYEKCLWKDQGQIQQNLVCGLNDQGKKFKDGQLFDAVISFLNKIKNDQQAKLLLISLMTLDLKTKERTIITDKIKQIKQYSNCQKTIQYLIGNQRIKLNMKKTKNNLILDRHLTKIQEIVKQISQGGQGGLKFFRVGRGNNSTSSKPLKSIVTGNLGRKKIGTQAKQQISSKPRLVVFISSAMGFNQIRSLSQYQSQYQIIYVSHNFVTPKQYIKKISMILDEDQL